MANRRHESPQGSSYPLIFSQQPVPDFKKPDMASLDTPNVIGIYGVSGCGKTYLLQRLKTILKNENIDFYDGSAIIDSITKGGLEEFKQLKEDEKTQQRQLAIDHVRFNSRKSNRIAVVAGHYMFWSDGERPGQTVCTANDLHTYTHILYLDTPPELILDRCLKDTDRKRSPLSIEHVKTWQETEKRELRQLCYEHGILFMLVPSGPDLLDNSVKLLQHVQHYNEKINSSYAISKLETFIDSFHPNEVETMLVMDADRTLSAQDTGKMFWDAAYQIKKSEYEQDPLKQLFSSKLGYSYAAFRQAALLYDETFDQDTFDNICDEVAAGTSMYANFVSLLKLVNGQKHVRVIIVTCGLARIWEAVLRKEGLSNGIKVIGGGRLSNGFVVTPEVKADLVVQLRSTYGMRVYAFGDSPVDLPMLKEADQAIVVVGDEQTRSKTMDAVLLQAIDNNGLKARQALVPSGASPRLSHRKLRPVQLTSRSFIESLVGQQFQPTELEVVSATEKTATKILMTPMRNANVQGPALRQAHQNVGWYLATEFLSNIIGLEDYQIPHVQGHNVSGHRLSHEEEILIVALMRGGEPMALGVSDAFPLARFLHAKNPEDIKPQHVESQITIVLVDSVVNSGDTIVQFVQHISGLHATIHIVIVTGVAQSQSIDKLKKLQKSVPFNRLSLVALRVSENRFTGRGGTDTGNRLFNTTNLD